MYYLCNSILSMTEEEELLELDKDAACYVLKTYGDSYKEKSSHLDDRLPINRIEFTREDGVPVVKYSYVSYALKKLLDIFVVKETGYIYKEQTKYKES